MKMLMITKGLHQNIFCKKLRLYVRYFVALPVCDVHSVFFCPFQSRSFSKVWCSEAFDRFSYLNLQHPASANNTTHICIYAFYFEIEGGHIKFFHMLVLPNVLQATWAPKNSHNIHIDFYFHWLCSYTQREPLLRIAESQVHTAHNFSGLLLKAPTLPYLW